MRAPVLARPRIVNPATLRRTVVAILLAATAGAQATDAPPTERQRVPLEQIAPAKAWPANAPESLPAELATRLDHVRRLMDENQSTEALNELDEILRAPQGMHYDTLYLLARIKFALGRLGESRAAAQQATVQRPHAVGAHYLLGRLAQQREDTDAAIAHFRSAASLDPQDEPQAAAAWWHLGRTLSTAGYTRAAAEALANFDQIVFATAPELTTSAPLESILRAHPYGAIEQRLELLATLGQTGQRVAAARTALEHHPDEPRLQRLFVQALLDNHEPVAAFEFCRRQLEANDADLSITLLPLAVEAARAAGQFDDWIAELRHGLADDQHVDLLRAIARHLGETGQPQLAATVWQALVETQPSSADLTWALATALMEAGKLQPAIDVLIDFRRAHPESVDLPVHWLRAWMQAFEHTQQFLQLVTEYTESGDCDAATYTVLGIAATAANEYDLAARLFAGALEEKPDDVMAHLGWARMLIETYRWEEARAHADQALDIQPDLAPAHLARALALAGLDYNEQANEAFKAAIERRPNDVAYLMAFARHCRRTGNQLAAQRYLQQAWALDHTNGEAVEQLVDSYLGSGKLPIARACFEEAQNADLSPDVLRRLRTTLEYADQALSNEHLAELRKQHTEHPQDQSTALTLAAGLFLHDHPDEALDVLDRVAWSSREAQQARYLRARVLLNMLRPADAIEILEKLRQQYPRRGSVISLLGEAYMVDFRVAEARDAFRRMIEVANTPQERNQARTQLLTSFVDFMEYDNALELLDQWIEAEPESESWVQARLQTLLMADRAEEAFNQARQRLNEATLQYEQVAHRFQVFSGRAPEGADDARSLEEQLGEAVNNLWARRTEFVEVCRQAERWIDAEREVRGWLAEQPDLVQVKKWLIEILLGGEKYAAALEVIATLNPETPNEMVELFGWRARALSGTGRVDEAVRDLENLLNEGFAQENPLRRMQLRQEIIRVLIEADEYTLAQRRCERWLADTPPDEELVRFEILMLYRIVLQAAEREHELIRITEQLLEMQPRDAGLNNDLGYTLADRGEQLERALKMIRLAVAAEPLNAAYLDSLGWVHYKRGDFTTALRYLSRAIQLRLGQDPVVHDHCGDAAYRTGQQQQAGEHWEKALEILRDADEETLTPLHTDLLATLREKLARLSAGEEPELAPTGREHQENP